MKNPSLITILFTLFTSVVAQDAFAHDIEVKNADGKSIYYRWINNKTELEVSYRGSDEEIYLDRYTGNIVIPKSVQYGGNTYSVTRIGGSAFDGCSGLTSVSIPDGVREIALNAFLGCKGLTSVTIPGSVNYIGDSAFGGCTNLNNIYSAIQTPFAISGNVFSTYSTATLTVPKGTKSAYQATAGWNKFYYINDGMEFERGNIGYTVTSSNTVAVKSASNNLTNVSIPESVSYNGSTYWVTAIEGFAFYKLQDINTVFIPGSVTSIGSSAFEDCTQLSSVTLKDGLTYIGGSTFEGCTALTSITFPSTVTTISINAFKNCSNLNDIVSKIQHPFAISRNVFSTYSTATLTVPKGTKPAYQSTAGWSNFSRIVDGDEKLEFTKDGVTYVESTAQNVVAKMVDKSWNWHKIPASVSYGGKTYQVTGVAEGIFDGSNMGALIWDLEAALPSNAFTKASIGSNFLLYVKSASYAPSTVKNVVVDGTAQTIALSDDGGQFYCPQTFIARNISYTHNYSMETGGSKGWEALALPFDVQEISHNTRGEIVPFPSYNSSSSKKPFWLANFSGNGFRRTAAVLANEPYIIAMPNNKNYRNEYNLAGEVTFSAENAAVPKTPTFDDQFVPAFAPVAKSSSVKALNNVSYSGGYDPGSRFISNLRDVHPFEAYMTGSSSRGIVEINFDDGTTDIPDILFSTDESQEITIHTLSGQQMVRTTQHDFDTVWQQLPKGIYIVNGKKWIK